MIRPVSTLLLLAALVAACGGGTSSPASVSDETTVTDGGDQADPTDEVLDTVSGGHQVIGKVTDSGGAPIVGAEVSVGVSTTSTADDGFFDLQAAEVGTLTISKPGYTSVELEWDGTQSFLRTTLSPFVVRGLRVGAEAVRTDEAFDALLALADATAVNAFVFDTKQEGGKVLYDTGVTEAHEIGAVAASYDPVARLAQVREHGIYAITRIVTFEDELKASVTPDQQLTGPWLNPTNKSTWEYPLALAAEACQLGFDEIQFDYVRFPSGVVGEGSGQLDLAEDERVAAIAAFLKEAKSRITPLGCAMSADVFGIIVSRPSDQGIGQRPEELSPHLDAISPMVYPSHYSDGWMGFDDPNEHPYDVTADAIDDALPRLAEGAELRPWLQAFWWTDDQIKRSIQAAEDRGVGWILWNAKSSYSAAALPTEAELGSTK